MLPLVSSAGAGILKGLTYLLKNPRIALFGAIGAVVAVMWLNLQIANKRLDALALENSNLRVKVELVQTEVAIQKEIVKITDGRIKTQAEASKKLEDLIEVIDSAPASDDGPVAPVLKRTLDLLP